MFPDLTNITTGQLLFFTAAMIWDVIWKGIGLWRSAENKQTGWFIAILLFNTIGILPIIYLNWFQRPPDSSTPISE